MTHVPAPTASPGTLPALRRGAAIRGRLGVTVPAAGLLLALTGCGSGSGTGDAKSPIAHDITLDEAAFHLHVEAGESGKGLTVTAKASS